MGYVAYGLMLIIAVILAFAIIRPFVTTTTTTSPFGPSGSIWFILIAIIIAIFLNALLIELGHLLGAKIGKYKILSWVCLGFAFKRGEDDKMHFGFGKWDGLTGETKIIPTDVKKNNPTPMIFMPFLFLLAEIVACAVLIVLGNINKGAWLWWGYLMGVIVIGVAAMIYLYDIFPAPLDSKNDGYLLTILTNSTNRVAYNELLLSEYNASIGKPVEKTSIYKDVTDFTSRINDVTLYKMFKERNYDGAMMILDYTIECKNKVSSNIYHEATSNKCAIILQTRAFEEAKEHFISLPLDDKKYMANLSSGAAIRAYLLASGLVEDSFSESEQAIGRAASVLGKLPDDRREIELSMLEDALNKVTKKHADWDFSEYNYVFGKEEPEESKEPEDAPAEKVNKPEEEPKE